MYKMGLKYMKIVQVLLNVCFYRSVVLANIFAGLLVLNTYSCNITSRYIADN